MMESWNNGGSRRPGIGFISHVLPSQGPGLPSGRAELGLFGTFRPAGSCPGRARLGSFRAVASLVGWGLPHRFLSASTNWVRSAKLARASPRWQGAGRESRHGPVLNPQSQIRNPQSRNWVRFAHLCSPRSRRDRGDWVRFARSAPRERRSPERHSDRNWVCLYNWPPASSRPTLRNRVRFALHPTPLRPRPTRHRREIGFVLHISPSSLAPRPQPRPY